MTFLKVHSGCDDKKNSSPKEALRLTQIINTSIRNSKAICVQQHSIIRRLTVNSVFSWLKERTCYHCLLIRLTENTCNFLWVTICDCLSHRQRRICFMPFSGTVRDMSDAIVCLDKARPTVYKIKQYVNLPAVWWIFGLPVLFTLKKLNPDYV